MRLLNKIYNYFKQTKIIKILAIVRALNFGPFQELNAPTHNVGNIRNQVETLINNDQVDRTVYEKQKQVELIGQQNITNESNNSKGNVRFQNKKEIHSVTTSHNYDVQLPSGLILRAYQQPRTSSSDIEILNFLKESRLKNVKTEFNIRDKNQPIKYVLNSYDSSTPTCAESSSKFSPGSKAIGRARSQAKTSNFFAEGFVVGNTPAQHGKNQPTLNNPTLTHSTCKPRVKLSETRPVTGNHPDQGNDGNGGKGLSNYRGGPSPFTNFDYGTEEQARTCLFPDKPTAAHLYDRHAHKCLGYPQNRSAKNEKAFQEEIRRLVQSSELTDWIPGTYRYEVPANHFRVKGSNLVITVDARDHRGITMRNATDYQLDMLESPDHNLGFDGRPLMHLRLRGNESNSSDQN